MKDIISDAFEHAITRARAEYRVRKSRIASEHATVVRELRAEYERIARPARLEYQEKIKAAKIAHDLIMDEIWADYGRAYKQAEVDRDNR